VRSPMPESSLLRELASELNLTSAAQCALGEALASPLSLTGPRLVGLTGSAGAWLDSRDREIGRRKRSSAVASRSTVQGRSQPAALQGVTAPADHLPVKRETTWTTS
jgi:hypothetical protein